MKLVHKPIPANFLEALPAGIKFVKKERKDFLVVEHVFCPRGHDLMADIVRIHGEPSVNVRLEIGESEGSVFIDAFWGGHAKLYNFIPDIVTAGPVLKAFCPVCGVDMIVDDRCGQPDCDCSKAVLFTLRDGVSKIYACARLGCSGHRMDIADFPVNVLNQVSEINYFGVHADDIFMEI